MLNFKPCKMGYVTFREDEQRKRAKHAAKNFAIVRKIALNLLKKTQGKNLYEQKD